MAKKLLIECPHCGRINEAKTGIFAPKNITCACGEKINIKDARMVTKECPHCGNMIVYDRGKTEDPECPVCHHHLLEGNEAYKTVEIICPDCSSHITVKKDDTDAVCPICGHHVNVQERMKFQKAMENGSPMLIKWDGGQGEGLVYEHPIHNMKIGSQIIVEEGQEAMVIIDGVCQAVYTPGRYTVEADSVFLNKENFNDDTTSLASKVVFVSTTLHSNYCWGTDSKIRMFEPTSGMAIELGAHGHFSYRINDPKTFLLNKNLVTQAASDENGFAQMLKTEIVQLVKSELARTIKLNNINVLEIDEHTQTIADQIKLIINTAFDRKGVFVSDFLINAITTPDDDPNFRRLKEQHAKRYLNVNEQKIDTEIAQAEHDKVMAQTINETDVELLKAKAQAEIARIKAQGEADSARIKGVGQADAYRAQATAEADEMKMKGYTYQEEGQREIETINAIKGNKKDELSDLAVQAAKLGVVKKVADNISSDVVNKVGLGKPDAWDCPECGTKDITTKFCPNCGHKH